MHCHRPRNWAIFITLVPFYALVVVRLKVNITKIWQIINLTDKTHPIYVYLGKFKLLKRYIFRTER